MNDEAHDLTARTSYAPGDTVVLASGGPLLTISEIRGDKALCLWFDAQDALSSAEIPTVCLMHSDPFDMSADDEGFGPGSSAADEDEDEDHGDKKKKKKKHRNGDA